MNAFTREGHGSRNPPCRDRRTRSFAVAAVVAAMAMPGCQAETLGPTGPRPAQRSDAPFTLLVRSDHMDESQCAIRITATATGGPDDAYAAWGELEGHSYDFDTNQQVRSRTQMLHPDVFEAARIATGETQWGQVDLEWFRRDAAEPVLVELEFHAVLHEEGGSGPGETKVTPLTVTCR